MPLYSPTITPDPDSSGITYVDDDGIVRIAADPSYDPTTIQADQATDSWEIVQEGFPSIGCRVYRSSNLTISTGTETTVTFDSERCDTNNMHSLTTNTERITVTTPGIYYIWFSARFNQNTGGGKRQLGVWLNNTTQITEGTWEVGAGDDALELHVDTCYHLNNGDYIVVKVLQNSGLDMTIATDANYSIEFAAQRIGV